MSPVVFAGPSLHGAGLESLSGLDLRPPAQCGDILAAVEDGTSIIGLIDGVFETRPAPWHKEILAALDRGARVYGAASLGALRAAECAAFGMTGIGEIYADYRDGRRVSDADVAVVHAPAELGFAPLSVALVDAQATLARLRSNGAIDARDADRLAEAAETIFFKDRTWSAIAGAAGRRELLPTIEAGAFSQKTRDAVLLLETVRNLSLANPSEAGRPTFHFSRTGFAMNLITRIGCRGDKPRPRT